MEERSLEPITNFPKRFNKSKYESHSLYQKCVGDLLDEVALRYSKTDIPLANSTKEKRKRMQVLLDWVHEEFDGVKGENQLDKFFKHI